MSDGFDIEAAANRLRKRYRARRRAEAERRSRAQQFARKAAAEMGRAVPPVKRIWGFGSTFEEWRPYRSDSDIDLAFEGGSTVDLEAALPGSEFHVSLVDLAEQDPAFASTVRSRSVLLYEKR